MNLFIRYKYLQKWDKPCSQLRKLLQKSILQIKLENISSSLGAHWASSVLYLGSPWALSDCGHLHSVRLLCCVELGLFHHHVLFCPGHTTSYLPFTPAGGLLVTILGLLCVCRA